MKIDAHQHFWKYSETEYAWLEGPLAPLRRDFLAEDLGRELESAGVGGSVAVEARQTLEETDWLLEIAERNEFVRGVTGWLPIASPNFGALLERYSGRPALKALRHVVQDEPDGFLSGRDFNAGIERLAGTGLLYEILIYERQLPEAIRFVDAHPKVRFVLDHMAKPKIAAGEVEPWATRLRELAKRENVVGCKMSGLVTEAGEGFSFEGLRPYMSATVDAFGTDRVMFGSDWPVMTASTTYGGWARFVEGFVGGDEGVMGGNAERVYGMV